MITPFDDCPPDAEWRPIPGWDEYAVSEYGHVRRTQGGKGTRAGRQRKPYAHDSKYVVYILSSGGVVKRCLGHRLVATSFLPPRPTLKHEVAHFDGNRQHNHYSNLRWATRAENVADMKRHGTGWPKEKVLRGEEHPNSKLRAETVLKIKHSSGRHKDIAKQYGVSKAAIQKIKSGKNWSWLT